MREVVGRRNIQAILTNEQSSVAQEVKEITQKALDEYGAGVRIEVVQLVSVQPAAGGAARLHRRERRPAGRRHARRTRPRPTRAARCRRPAVRPRRSSRQAEAYRTKATADATGQAARFSEVYDSYKAAPAISRERIFLETMERVLGSVNKVIIDQNGAGGAGTAAAAGVLPVLPLTEFGRPRRRPQTGAAR